MDSAAKPDSLRFLTFRVAQRVYALGAEEVAEVIRVPVLARVPQSPRALLGIGNLRGAVVPFISLRGLLALEVTEADPLAQAIVLDSGARVALVVDAVDALVGMASASVETEPANLAALPGERLTAAFKRPVDQVVAKVLDVQELLGATFTKRKKAEHRARRSVTRSHSDSAGEAAAAAEVLVTFEVAGQEFALELAAVQEILPAPASVTGVPRTDAPVLGMTSHRDALLPLLSLRGLLGFPPAPAATTREKVVVMKIAGAQVGLVADRARAIVSAEMELVDPIPPVLASRTGGEARIRAIYRGAGGTRLISILAPDQLFREDLMNRLNAGQATQSMDAPLDPARTGGEVNFLVFRLGEDEFGVPIEAVDEVAQVPAQITRLPKTPKFLEGVVNLRGDVLPVIDQRRRFDMPDIEASGTRRLVVVRTQNHRAGLIVDSVADVLRTTEDAVEPAPDLTEDTSRLVRGVINLHDAGRIVLLLDPTELLTRAERGLLDAFQAEAERAGA